MKWPWMIFILIILLFLAWNLWGLFSTHNLDKPTYTIQKTYDSIEVRLYDSMILASVRVQGNQSQAINEGFRSVAGYIFGGNTSKESIAMTAPVTAESEEIAMTTPVTAEMQTGSYVISFMMPHTYTFDQLPTPKEKDVQLTQVPETLRAVRSFGGHANTDRANQQLALFQKALQNTELQTKGNFTLAQYNDPWTPARLRHNEWWVEIEQDTKS